MIVDPGGHISTQIAGQVIVNVVDGFETIGQHTVSVCQFRSEQQEDENVHPFDFLAKQFVSNAFERVIVDRLVMFDGIVELFAHLSDFVLVFEQQIMTQLTKCVDHFLATNVGQNIGTGTGSSILR